MQCSFKRRILVALKQNTIVIMCVNSSVHPTQIIIDQSNSLNSMISTNLRVNCHMRGLIFQVIVECPPYEFVIDCNQVSFSYYFVCVTRNNVSYNFSVAHISQHYDDETSHLRFHVETVSPVSCRTSFLFCLRSQQHCCSILHKKFQSSRETQRVYFYLVWQQKSTTHNERLELNCMPPLY